MSPRKTILRELSTRYAPGEPVYTRPPTIPGFGAEPEKYQKAVNTLLQERLIEGRRDEGGSMAIALNEHRIEDVRKELRPLWARPGTWILLVAILAAAAGLVAA